MNQDEYLSEQLNSEECKIYTRAKRAIRSGQQTIKVDAREIEGILICLDVYRRNAVKKANRPIIGKGQDY